MRQYLRKNKGYEGQRILAWGNGQVRFYDGRTLRDLGLMKCKEQAQAWCAVNRVRFLQELPWSWATVSATGKRNSVTQH